MSRRRKNSERDRLAREHHRCPEGYEGPCWGPTAADYEYADSFIEAQREEA